MLRSKKAREIPFAEAVAQLEAEAGSDEAAQRAVSMLKDMNRDGGFDDTEFDRVWSLLQAASKLADG